MRVSFNEDANVFVPDNLSTQERKKMWTHAATILPHDTNANTQGKTRKTKRGDSIHLAAILEYVVLNSYEAIIVWRSSRSADDRSARLFDASLMNTVP
ncbi:hypothetical protein MHU86_2218 [Fragilaria crotonensis]|nr:hypothetical protein MHU86_2218 [Fragilaria crotonensis]